MLCTIGFVVLFREAWDKNLRIHFCNIKGVKMPVRFSWVSPSLAHIW